MAKFDYTDLDRSKASIRLLTLLPEVDDKIAPHCLLSHVSLGDEPVFEALSYTWGPPIENHNGTEPTLSMQSIMLDNVPFDVGKNLYDALLRLRRADANRVLWVDAVCINQSDIPERNHQVTQMGRVYSSAARAVIWLGEKDDHTDIALDWLEKLAEMRRILDSGQVTPDEMTLSTHTGPENMDGMVQLEVHLPKWNALQYLMGRSWWRRVWTIQEFALAIEAVFLIGNTEIPLTTMETALRGISPHHGTLQQILARGLHSGVIDQALNWGRPLNHYSLRSFVKRNSDSAEATVSDTMTKDRRDALDLFSVLRGSASASCHEARDRIFAVLGLCNKSVQTSIPIDYEQDILTVFGQVAFHLITGLQSLSLLTDESMERCFKVTSPVKLPSWIPQERHSVHTAKIDDQDKSMDGSAYHTYDASQGANAVVKVSNDFTTLYAEGVIIDTVDNLGEPATDLAADPKKIYYDLSEFLNLPEVGQRPYPHKTKPRWGGEVSDPITIEEAFWLAICLGQIPGNKPWTSTSDDGDQNKAQSRDRTRIYMRPRQFMDIRFINYPPENDEEREALIWTLFDRHLSGGSPGAGYPPVLHRRVFRSRKGFIGLAPECAEAGDHIAVLLGSRVPFLLRETGNGFSFVDECYVEGMMHGEIIEDERAGKHRVEAIAIY